MNRTLAPHEIVVEADAQQLPGMLTVPDDAVGLVVFVHGSGSSRRSPRNAAVARSLANRGFATFLFDLLTPDEADDRRNVFDIALLARRVTEATGKLSAQDEIQNLPLGYFGASTGAAAALVSAADLGNVIRAVVSRGGRPDLAGPALPRVTAPTRLIVGSRDVEVLELNRAAQQQLRAASDLVIVDGATHLFEEPGALEQVAELASEWFERHLHLRAD